MNTRVSWNLLSKVKQTLKDDMGVLTWEGSSDPLEVRSIEEADLEDDRSATASSSGS